jgi:hypothetical protein
MPLAVIEGALSAHPVVRRNGTYRINPFYDTSIRSLHPVEPVTVTSKLAQLDMPSLPNGRLPQNGTTCPRRR